MKHIFASRLKTHSISSSAGNAYFVKCIFIILQQWLMTAWISIMSLPFECHHIRGCAFTEAAKQSKHRGDEDEVNYEGWLLFSRRVGGRQCWKTDAVCCAVVPPLFDFDHLNLDSHADHASGLRAALVSSWLCDVSEGAPDLTLEVRCLLFARGCLSVSWCLQFAWFLFDWLQPSSSSITHQRCVSAQRTLTGQMLFVCHIIFSQWASGAAAPWKAQRAAAVVEIPANSNHPSPEWRLSASLKNK